MEIPESAAFEMIGRQALEIHILRQQIAAYQAELNKRSEAQEQPFLGSVEKGLLRAEG